MSLLGEADVCHNESELEKLRAFVDDTDSWIDQTLETLGWTREHVLKVHIVHSDYRTVKMVPLSRRLRYHQQFI